MNKEVLISINGMQIGSEEEPVIITACGTYHLTNGRHYIQYEEKVEDSEAVLKSMMKISQDRIVLSKKGIYSSQMVFDIKEADQAVYQTPYGNFIFETHTKSIVLKETQKSLEVKMEYSLSSDNAKVSDNEITILIKEL